MNDLVAFVFHVEVRDVERGDCLKRQQERLIDLPAAAPSSQVASDLSQRTEDLRAIESLTVTVFAETHEWTRLVCLTSRGRRPSALDAGASPGEGSGISRAWPSAASFFWRAFRRPSFKACLCSSLSDRRGLSFVGRTALAAFFVVS